MVVLPPPVLLPPTGLGLAGLAANGSSNGSVGSSVDGSGHGGNNSGNVTPSTLSYSGVPSTGPSRYDPLLLTSRSPLPFLFYYYAHINTHTHNAFLPSRSLPPSQCQYTYQPFDTSLLINSILRYTPRPQRNTPIYHNYYTFSCFTVPTPLHVETATTTTMVATTVLVGVVGVREGLTVRRNNSHSLVPPRINVTERCQIDRARVVLPVPFPLHRCNNDGVVTMATTTVVTTVAVVVVGIMRMPVAAVVTTCELRRPIGKAPRKRTRSVCQQPPSPPVDIFKLLTSPINTPY